ncbi:MAG: SRPBCC family protein [Nannocystales bacterium]
MTNRLSFGALFVNLLGCASTAPAESAAPIAVGEASSQLDGKRYRETRVGVHIDAPPAAVWAVLTDGPAYPSWNSTVTSLEGTIAPGEEIKLKVKLDPKRTFNLEVSTFEAPTRLVWQDGNAMFKGVRTFTLTALPDGSTDVTMAEVMTGSMMGMIAKKLPDFRPDFDTFMRDLKATVETAAQTTAT